MRLFWSPSDQDNNQVHGGGHEQQYAQARAAAGAAVLRAAGHTVKISEEGIGDDAYGWATSARESNAWGAEIHIEDHTNATAKPVDTVSGVIVFYHSTDPEGRRLAQCIAARLDPLLPGGSAVVPGDQYGAINMTNARTVLIEGGFHNNPLDAQIIRTKPVEMGQAIAYGVLDYLGQSINNIGDAIMATIDEMKQAIREVLAEPHTKGHIGNGVWSAAFGRGANRVTAGVLLQRAANVWLAWFGRGERRRTAAQLLAGTSSGVDRIEAIVTPADVEEPEVTS